MGARLVLTKVTVEHFILLKIQIIVYLLESYLVLLIYYSFLLGSYLMAQIYFFFILIEVYHTDSEMHKCVGLKEFFHMHTLMFSPLILR